MRCFIAIDVDKEVKDALSELIEKLKRQRANVRWVRGEGIHLTLRFLGEIDEKRVDRIKEAIERSVKGKRCFYMNLKGTGVFPSFSRPRVLWVAVEDSPQLKEIYENLQTELEKLGFEKEKRNFHPHITLGRVKSTRGIEGLLGELRRYKEREFGKIYVDRVVLMQSILKPEGAEYREIFFTKLDA
jgi:2'-5' RNA ligase